MNRYCYQSEKYFSYINIHLFVIVLMVALTTNAIHAQEPKYPFPNHTEYSKGIIKPTNFSQSAMDKSVESFFSVW